VYIEGLLAIIQASDMVKMRVRDKDESDIQILCPDKCAQLIGVRRDIDNKPFFCFIIKNEVGVSVQLSQYKSFKL
jgi:hypothetical protein